MVEVVPSRLLGGEDPLDRCVQRGHGGVPQDRVKGFIGTADEDTAHEPVVCVLLAAPDDRHDVLRVHGFDCGDALRHGAGLIVLGIAQHDAVPGDQGGGYLGALIGCGHEHFSLLGFRNNI